MRGLVIATVLTTLAGLAAPAAADRTAAERFFRAGEKAYQQQNFEAAAAAFELAFKELPLPEIAFSAAQAYRRQYRVDARPEYVVKAVEHYKFYLAHVKTGGRVGDAADSLGEMQHEYDKLAAAGKIGNAAATVVTRLGVSVVLGDPNAPVMREIEDTSGVQHVAITATIDGKPVEANAMIPVEPGEHLVSAVAPGFLPADKRVNSIPGSSDIIELSLAPRPATVALATEPGAHIIIDGRPIGSAPHAAVELPAGRHVVTIAKDGREPEGRELVVARAQQIALDVPLEPTRRRRAVPWMLIGTGVLALATGVEAVGVWRWDNRAAELRDRLAMGDQPQSVLDEYNSARDRRDVVERVLWGSAVLTIAAGATTAWLYYFDHPSTEGLHLTPVAAPGNAGAMLFGRF